jgi:hypothetical protein
MDMETTLALLRRSLRQRAEMETRHAAGHAPARARRAVAVVRDEDDEEEEEEEVEVDADTDNHTPAPEPDAAPTHESAFARRFLSRAHRHLGDTEEVLAAATRPQHHDAPTRDRHWDKAEVAMAAEQLDLVAFSDDRAQWGAFAGMGGELEALARGIA